MCTCSALTSAFIYAAINQMEDAAVEHWHKKYKSVLMLPMMKFVGGVMCYMVSVIMTSWRDLEGDDMAQNIALVIGVMSVLMVWLAFFAIRSSMLSKPTGKQQVAVRTKTVGVKTKTVSAQG